jgi:alkylated DNA repair dioxygenase AlkB
LAEWGDPEEFRDSGLFLWRGGMQQSCADDLACKAGPIMQDINYAGAKMPKVGPYKSDLAVSRPECSCKYDYIGSSRQVLYHRGGTGSLQPKTVTQFVDQVFTVLDEWRVGKYPMTSCPSDLVAPLGQGPQELHEPRDFNLIVVNDYNFQKEPHTHIPWHDDAMEQSVRDTMDEVLTPVLSISLGDSAVFAVMPNTKKAPGLCERMSAYSTRWGNIKTTINGRFAFWLHHGDILLMTGAFQRHFQHKTWKRNEGFKDNEILRKHALGHSYTFLGHEDSKIKTDLKRRFVVTARHIHYRNKQCGLAVLPACQHAPTTTTGAVISSASDRLMTWPAPPATPEEIVDVEMKHTSSMMLKAMSDDDYPASPPIRYSRTRTPSDRSATEAEAGETMKALIQIPITGHNTEVVLQTHQSIHHPKARTNP